MNGLSVLEWFQLSNGDLIIFVACLQHLQRASTKMTKLGQGVEVKAHYPIFVVLYYNHNINSDRAMMQNITADHNCLTTNLQYYLMQNLVYINGNI